MNDDGYDTVTESITTEADGPDTVNERLTTGGPGPEGQPDTVHEILSGQQSKPPTASAKKDAWVEHALANGATDEEVSSMTKAELIEKYGE